MRIHRSHPDENFTILPNATLQDERLSFVALGILCQLISRPTDWKATADSLWQQKQQKQGKKTGQGREALRAAFTELERLGYLVRRKTKGEGGQWVTTMDLYDTPGHHADEIADPSTDPWSVIDEMRAAEERKASMVRGTEFDRASANVALLQRTEPQRQIQRTDNKDSSTLADARVGALSSAREINDEAEAADPWALVDEARQAEIVREVVINGGTVEEGLAQAAAQARKVTLAMRGRDSELDALSAAVDRVPPNQLSDTLVGLESRRKKVYGNARRAAMAYLEREDRQIIRGPNGGHVMQTLVYKHLLLHYFETAEEWPAWLIRPLNAYMGRAA